MKQRKYGVKKLKNTDIAKEYKQEIRNSYSIITPTNAHTH